MARAHTLPMVFSAAGFGFGLGGVHSFQSSPSGVVRRRYAARWMWFSTSLCLRQGVQYRRVAPTFSITLPQIAQRRVKLARLLILVPSFPSAASGRHAAGHCRRVCRHPTAPAGTARPRSAARPEKPAQIARCTRPDMRWHPVPSPDLQRSTQLPS